MGDQNLISIIYRFNNSAFDETPPLENVDALITNPSSLQTCLTEEAIIRKDSVNLEMGYFESHYKEFKSLDPGLRSNLFSYIVTYSHYLTSAFASAIRLNLLKYIILSLTIFSL